MISLQLKKRLQTSSIAILLFSFFIYYSFHPFFKICFILLHACLVSLTLSEYYSLAEKKGFRPLKYEAMIISFLYILLIGLYVHQSSFVFPFALLLGLSTFIFFFLLFFTSSYTEPLVNLALTQFGFLYITLPLSCIVLLNYYFLPPILQDGRLWLVYGICVSKMTDIGAYTFGKIFGKRLLSPFISPKKTIVGAVSGFLIGTSTSVIYSWLLASYGFVLNFLPSLLLGSTLSVLAQLGDLTESLLKRDAGIKDSSYLPGLGGLLDTLDSLLFTLPFLYIFLYMQ